MESISREDDEGQGGATHTRTHIHTHTHTSTPHDCRPAPGSTCRRMNTADVVYNTPVIRPTDAGPNTTAVNAATYENSSAR